MTREKDFIVLFKDFDKKFKEKTKQYEERKNKEAKKEEENEKRIKKLKKKVVEPAFNPLIKLMDKYGLNGKIFLSTVKDIDEVQHEVLITVGQKGNGVDYFGIEIYESSSRGKLDLLLMHYIDEKETRKTITIDEKKLTGDFLKELIFDGTKELLTQLANGDFMMPDYMPHEEDDDILG